MTTASAAWPVPAELTIPTAAALREQLLDALAQGVEALDLSAVHEIDSAGAQLLLAARREAEGRGRPLALLNAGDSLNEVADRLGLREALFGDDGR